MSEEILNAEQVAGSRWKFRTLGDAAEGIDSNSFHIVTIDEAGWVNGPVELPCRVAQQPQSQASLDEQLRVLHVAAARLGLYDAADWLWRTSLNVHDSGKEPE